MYWEWLHWFVSSAPSCSFHSFFPPSLHPPYLPPPFLWDNKHIPFSAPYKVWLALRPWAPQSASENPVRAFSMCLGTPVYIGESCEGFLYVSFFPPKRESGEFLFHYRIKPNYFLFNCTYLSGHSILWWKRWGEGINKSIKVKHRVGERREGGGERRLEGTLTYRT